MKIAIFGTTYNERYDKHLLQIIEILRSKSIEICIEEEFFEFIEKRCGLQAGSHIKVCQASEVEADMAISFGGDGTFLVTAKHLATKGTPILGINAGNLGFLADVAIDRIEQCLSKIIDGEYHIVERTMLEAKIVGKEESNLLALNEVSVLWHKELSMISIDLEVDGEAVATYKADGLLIATPTGSTAYALSVGGPIITPSSKNFLIMPIAPHSLTVRPLIVPDSSVMRIKAHTHNHYYQVSADGYSASLPVAQEIEIRKSPFITRSVEPLGGTFFRTIRQKLMWGADVRS